MGAALKILFIHEVIGDHGGAESNLRATAKALALRGHEVWLAHGRSTGKNLAAWEQIFDGCLDFSQHCITAILALTNPDVIYVHKTSDLPLLKALAKYPAPVARMVHDHDLYCMRSYKYNPFTRNICERAASAYCALGCLACVKRDRGGFLPVKWVSLGEKLAEIEINHRFERMVVAGEFMRGELLKNGFDPKRISIHAPVSGHSSKGEKASLSSRNLLLYVGQVIRGKGVDVLLKSLALVESPFECVILGDGNHRGYCEQLAKDLGLQDRVSFKGFVSQDQLNAYYREASAMLVSSLWPEPFGMIGQEAMRHALPIVGFDAGGVKEWLHDGVNGFLVPWMDHITYAQKVNSLLQDKKLASRMGEQGQKSVAEQYDSDRYFDGLEALFRELASNSGTIPHMNASTLLTTV